MALEKFAIVENGKVINVAVWDPVKPENWIRSDAASIGDSWDGEKFTRPDPLPMPKPEPTLVDVVDALKKAGILKE